MSDMLKVFLQDIPSIIFEPIAVIAVLGLITAAIIYRKERSVLYWTIFFSLIFMILWRIAIKIVSSRYAEILIYPAIIATVFFLFQLGNIRKIWPQIPEKAVKYLPFLCIAILTVVCIVKNLNYDRSCAIIDTTNMVKAEMQPDSGIYSAHPNWNWKIEYYVGKKVDSLPEIKNDPQILQCQKIISDAAVKKYRTIYIFVPCRTREPEITADDLGVKKNAWTFVGGSCFNEEKTKIMRVYKYSISERNDSLSVQ